MTKILMIIKWKKVENIYTDPILKCILKRKILLFKKKPCYFYNLYSILIK